MVTKDIAALESLEDMRENAVEEFLVNNEESRSFGIRWGVTRCKHSFNPMSCRHGGESQIPIMKLAVIFELRVVSDRAFDALGELLMR